MRTVPKSASSKSFTLRLPKKVLNRLDQYCQRTLYTRQQAFQIAVCTSLKSLGVNYFVLPSKAAA
jgi:metal-responsive CopG/Arc/MetJ family transcriptional regulator